MNIENPIYTEHTFLSKSPNPLFNSSPMVMRMFHVTGTYDNKKEFRQRYKVSYL